MKTALYTFRIGLSRLLIETHFRETVPDMYSVKKTKNRSMGKVAQRKRSAVIMLELILVLPILLFLLSAIVQIGMMLSNLKYVQLAAFEGAKLASVMDRDELSDATPAIKERVDQILQSAGLGESCKIIFRQNVPRVSPGKQTLGDCDCNTSDTNRLPREPNGAVRVIVCVRLSQVSPDMLSFWGFSPDGKLVQTQATLPYLK